jgi:UDP-N-acetylglucosamine diphosphorylase / glucose-1-phosphate thymidylyltransferase / UDP-N-acetylgalactosamine diphosphorylase / glucosamine-1-phosphate N-acetyltransferase / galactosamine-1-phosphate N-acetyltransferase
MDTKVVIMCGGIGKRMRPMTADKSLLEFAGKPLIVHHIESAIAAGLGKFVIIANPENSEGIRNVLSGFHDITVDYAIQQKPGGMSDALLSATQFLSGNPFILVNSNDIFSTKAYDSLLSTYKSNQDYSIYMTAYQVQTYFPGGYLVINEKSELCRIIEKPPAGEEPSDLVNIVIHLHTRPDILFDYLSSTASPGDDIYEQAIDRMIGDNYKCKVVPYTGMWKAIKYPWHILDVMDYFAEQITGYISPASHVSDKAIIDGNVILDENVRIFEGAIIRGPSYIGRNTIIGNNVLIRDSFIGADCVVGYGTEVKHSYIGCNCWFHSNYIGDSVIEDNCSFGAGAVTANFRHDEASIKTIGSEDKMDTGRNKLGAIIGNGCRIGINSSLMPGIRVGANSFIGAHVCLNRDLEANKLVLAESAYRVLPNTAQPYQNNREELRRKLTK